VTTRKNPTDGDDNRKQEPSSFSAFPNDRVKRVRSEHQTVSADAKVGAARFESFRPAAVHLLSRRPEASPELLREPEVSPRYNIAPTQDAAVIRLSRTSARGNLRCRSTRTLNEPRIGGERRPSAS
jgi:hypothetical protein